jgi:hypothetical protein
MSLLPPLSLPLPDAAEEDALVSCSPPMPPSMAFKNQAPVG